MKVGGIGGEGVGRVVGKGEQGGGYGWGERGEGEWGAGEVACRSPDWPWGSAVESALVERECRREAARGEEEEGGGHPRG